MSDRMKILIGYDGSAPSEAALADLGRAGLPAEADVLVVAVAEVWLRDESLENETPEGQASSAYVMSLRAREGLLDAEVKARKAADHLAAAFPGWKVETKVYPDSPAWGLLRAADEWVPDLVIVGSHGRGAIGRLVLGSVSQKVLTEARSSVRIARNRDEVVGSPARIVLGMDDTPDSLAALDSVAARSWPAGSAVRVVAAIEPTDLPIGVPINYDVTQWVEEGTMQQRQRLERAATAAVEKLRGAGLAADAIVAEGAPVRMILDEAKNLGADCIVLGARGHRFMERFLLGSVSAAVAARADCSVEIVRPKTEVP